MLKIKIKSTKRQELIDISDLVKAELEENKVVDGICFLFCPHTTAALTINSYLDPATATDLVSEIDRIVPTRTDFVHTFDTPSDAAAHVKASLIGGQVTVIVEDGELQMGGSQGLLFWEFDGPRDRQIYLTLIS